MNASCISVPIDILATLTPEGYARRFWDIVNASALNHREAWEIVEAERAAFMIPERYSCYESFRARGPHLVLLRNENE